jgi:hypothetical protein
MIHKNLKLHIEKLTFLFTFLNNSVLKLLGRPEEGLFDFYNIPAQNVQYECNRKKIPDNPSWGTMHSTCQVILSFSWTIEEQTVPDLWRM